MYGALLYRLNYEEYQKREAEIDEKIKKLSLEGDDEDIMPLDEAYIISLNTEDEEEYTIQDKGYFVVLIGDYDFDREYADEVIFGIDKDYARYLELDKMDIESMESNAVDEKFRLRERFTTYEDEEVSDILDEIMNEECDFGRLIKRIF